MKTMIFWLRKRCRTPKMVGLATAKGSVLTIHDMSKMAHNGEGRLFIIDGINAAEGRKDIKAFLNKSKQFPMVFGQGDINKPCIVAIGVNACKAIAGAAEGARNWENRRLRDGIVKWDDTKAIGKRTDGIQPSPLDFFGGN